MPEIRYFSFQACGQSVWSDFISRGRLAAAGIDLDHVTRQLQAEAVTLFTTSFDTLIETVERKRHGLLADRVKHPVVG